MKRLAIAILMTLLAAGIAAAEPADGGKALSVRTFKFNYKDADRAAAIIKPLLSAEGSMSIQPSANSLVVTDRPDVLKSVAGALTEFDAPARAVKLSVRLVAAGYSPNGGGAPAELREIAGKLAVLRYNQIENLGEVNVEGREGEPGSIELESGYRADFRFGEFDPTSDSIRLNDFKLSKLQKNQLVQLYKASLNLRLGQTVMFGATRTQGQRAVFLVLVARR